MSVDVLQHETDETPVATPEAQSSALEQKLTEAKRHWEERLIYAELKVEAVKAGMFDLDGLRILDRSSARLNEKGEIEGGHEIMARFKQAKPWLFGGQSSSNTTEAPSARPLRQKLATEMTDAEYARARAALLKQCY